MIVHCVFLRLKAALTPEERDALYRDIASLKSVVPGVADLRAGPNISHERLDGGFSDGFIVTFDSVDARDRYLAHPAHQAVSERLIHATDGGLAGILVYDLAA